MSDNQPWGCPLDAIEDREDEVRQQALARRLEELRINDEVARQVSRHLRDISAKACMAYELASLDYLQARRSYDAEFNPPQRTPDDTNDCNEIPF